MTNANAIDLCDYCSAPHGSAETVHEVGCPTRERLASLRAMKTEEERGIAWRKASREAEDAAVARAQKIATDYAAGPRTAQGEAEAASQISACYGGNINAAWQVMAVAMRQTQTLTTGRVIYLSRFGWFGAVRSDMTPAEHEEAWDAAQKYYTECA